MRHGLPEGVIPQAHQLLRLVRRGLEVTGEARPEHPDVPGRGQVKHPEGALLAVLGGPDRHHGQRSAGIHVDPLRTRDGQLVGLGVKERRRPLAPTVPRTVRETPASGANRNSAMRSWQYSFTWTSLPGAGPP